MKFSVFGLIAVLALHVTVSALTCPSYTCDAALTNNVCAKKTQAEVRLKVCSGVHEYCPTSVGFDEEVTCKNITKELLPGDYCTDGTQCLSGTCKENVCVGAGKEATCTSDENCTVGLHCFESKCADVVAIGGDCSAAKKCEPAAFCDPTGKCIARAQLLEGAATTSAEACITQHKNDTHCIAGPKYLNTSYDCPVYGMCNYTYEGKLIQEGCVCGRNGKGTSYCRHGSGDISLDDVKIITFYVIFF